MNNVVDRPALAIVSAFLGFAAIHSLTAGNALKTALRRWLSPRLVEGWYRLAYNMVSIITLLPAVYFTLASPDDTFYRLRGFWLAALMLVQLGGAIGLAVSLLSIDLLGFLGLKQGWAFLSGQPLPLPGETLQTNGVYALSRHPLYVFSLMILWASPTMSMNFLAVNICATAYFVFGALIEERRLLQTYGKVYEDYCQRVSWLTICPKQGQKAPEQADTTID